MKADEKTCGGCRFKWFGEVGRHFVRWQCREGERPWKLIKLEDAGCKKWRKK